MIGQKERRKYSRLNSFHLLKYRLVSEPQKEPVLATIRDISGGGIRILTEEEIPKSSILQVYINFPQFPQPVPSVAKVVWSRRLKSVKKYESGLEFMEIDEGLRHDMMGRIESVNKKVNERGR